MLKVQHVSGGYTNQPILKDISFEVSKGEFYGILGPNGSGKTTLLKMISGLLPISKGKISIMNRDIYEYSSKELAKIVAVLPQHAHHVFSYTVKETVALGRYAHQNSWFQTWSKEDEEVVQHAMQQTGVNSLKDKTLEQLSGGERQRVYLSQALAQEPKILLLDEPTNHLDLSYQKELLDVLKKWTKERELTVISIFHDLNLSGLYCDRLLLLEKGIININHKTNRVLKQERIKAVYDTEIEKITHPKVAVPQMALLPEWEKEMDVKIEPNMLQLEQEHIILHSPVPLKTMSSGVVGSGFGWHQTFVNRHVAKNYSCVDYRQDMVNYIENIGFDPLESVGMMTAVMLEDAVYKYFEENNTSIFIVVTAGVGNAVDVAKSDMHSSEFIPGTINTWIFINGDLTEEAFIQAIVTATEAKVKALENQGVKDSISDTQATGTSTDSILVASTQQGEKHEFAGTISPLGKLIGKGVYECTLEAVKKNLKRNKE